MVDRHLCDWAGDISKAVDSSQYAEARAHIL